MTGKRSGTGPETNGTRERLDKSAAPTKEPAQCDFCGKALWSQLVQPCRQGVLFPLLPRSVLDPPPECPGQGPLTSSWTRKIRWKREQSRVRWPLAIRVSPVSRDDLGSRERPQGLHTVHLDDVAVGNPSSSCSSAWFLWSLVSFSFSLASFPCLSTAFPSVSRPRSHLHPMHVVPTKDSFGRPAASRNCQVSERMAVSRGSETTDAGPSPPYGLRSVSPSCFLVVSTAVCHHCPRLFNASLCCSKNRM